MTRKYFIIPLFLTVFCVAENVTVSFEYEGIPIMMKDKKGKSYQIIVKRDIPDECRKVPINNEMMWTANYANSKVPEACKSTYVHTPGKLQPIRLEHDVETYGELEVLAFMKEMQKNPNMMLIDGRKESWYVYRTIPGAVNMPFHHFKERNAFEFEFEQHLRTLGVKIKDDEDLDFDNAKEIVIFCNGPWCSQSVAMIYALVELDYPEEKIKWYRGGMETWLGAGMTTTRK